MSRPTIPPTIGSFRIHSSPTRPTLLVAVWLLVSRSSPLDGSWFVVPTLTDPPAGGSKREIESAAACDALKLVSVQEIESYDDLVHRFVVIS